MYIDAKLYRIQAAVGHPRTGYSMVKYGDGYFIRCEYSGLMVEYVNTYDDAMTVMLARAGVTAKRNINTRFN